MFPRCIRAIRAVLPSLTHHHFVATDIRRLLGSSALSLLLFLVAFSAPLGSAQNAGNNTASSYFQASISPQFMDLITHWPIPWPTIPFYGLRLMPTDTNWSQINTAEGVYDWTTVDMWLSAGKANGTDLLFTLAFTPTWASSNPGDTSCRSQLGCCDPPNDVNPDGSGTDRHWKDFVTAVANHVGSLVTYWEIWNEPRNQVFWTGTPAQLARMAEDARTIIRSVNPNARLMNGGSGGMSSFDLKWWDSYAAAGGLEWADIIAIHGDVRIFPQVCGVYPVPENFLTNIANIRSVLNKYGQGGKPIWDTEASWGPTNADCFTNQDLQAAFLARFFLLHRSAGIGRFYWRAWIDGAGGLYDQSTGLNKAGFAYVQIHNWLVGNTLTAPCSAHRTVWTCNFTGPNGYVAQAIWNTAESCSDGSCSTVPYSIGSQYKKYRTLAGETVTIVGTTVPIGAKPILVEN
jgi:hypothetical protein